MDVTSDPATHELALLKPRQSLGNVGEKKDDEKDKEAGFQAFGADGFTFLDFLDIVNPLQHIPIVATLYRELTGDTIDPGSRIAGGTLFGGPIGAVIATTNVALRETTGKDMGDHVVAFLEGEAGPEADPVKLASGPQGVSTGVELAGLNPLSPITANMEVLEWARRETALMAGAPAPATAQTPAVKPVDDIGSQTVAAKKLPGGGPAQPYEIAANVEVLDWARGEALLAQSPGLLQERRDQTQTRDRERLSGLDAARQQAVAAGLTQEQLTGAAAPSGGWFSETMLLALASYQDSAGLGKAARIPVEIGAADENMGE